jgi:hypothetical protein
MKVSRSTSRPRRLKRHGSGGPWVGVLAILVVLGSGAWLGDRLGWWSAKDRSPAAGVAKAGGRPPVHVAESRPAGTTRPAEGESRVTAAVPAVPESLVPNGAPIVVPRFGKDFEDALARGAFREAEGALARIGGAADAEQRLRVAMDAARTRIASRYEEIRKDNGERAARLYVSRQLESFPDKVPARSALEALIASTEGAPPEPVAAAPSSKPAPAAEPGPAAPPTPSAPSADLVAMKDEASRVLDSGEIKAALSVLREVATAAEAQHENAVLADARRLVRQAEAELRLRQAIVDRVATGPPATRPVQHLPGEKGAIVAANEDGVTFASTQGQVALKWRVLPVHALSGIIHALELGPAGLVDGAAVLYRAGNAAEADALLIKASAAGGDRRAIDQTIADARRMSLPPAGFRLVEDKWLSPQEFARHELLRDIAQSTKDLASPDAAIRRAAFARMVKLGDAAKSPLHRALLLRRAEVREDLQKAPVHAKLAELGGRRRELDEARAHALELIEDEVRYPYPYRPPQATAEQFKAYSESQREIDIRVAKLRTLWNQQIGVTVPKAFREKVALLNEVGAFLAELGAAPVEADPPWLVFLPASDEVTLQTVATSESDRRRIDESAEVMKLNVTKPTKST